MTKILQCSDKECSTHTDPDSYMPLFKITLLVMADRDGAEELRKIKPDCFSCYCCGSEAEEIELHSQTLEDEDA